MYLWCVTAAERAGVETEILRRGSFDVLTPTGHDRRPHGNDQMLIIRYEDLRYDETEIIVREKRGGSTRIKEKYLLKMQRKTP
jgi:hypothetical protein